MSHEPVSALTAVRAASDADRPVLLPTYRPLSDAAAAPTDQPDDRPSLPRSPSADATVAIAGTSPGDRAPTQAYARFSIDPETNIVSLSIVDAATHTVIRQVPSEEVLELARLMQTQAERLGRATAASLAAPSAQKVDRRV
jgi:hypothetical protein